jgi:hypothetical protein
MSVSIRLVAAGMLLCAGTEAAAQTPPPQQETRSDSEIVVTGERNFERQVRSFVRALTPARSGDQLARFETAFCPVVWGLVPAQAESVRRLRAVAAAAEIEVGKADCTPNAFVIVVDDKKAFVQGLAGARPRAFGELTALQIRRLARSPGHVAAWQLTGQLDAGGMPIVSDGSGPPINQTTEFASRATPAARRHFEAAAVVIEKRGLAGLTITQLADYSAMRLLARTEPSQLGDAAERSILAVIDTPMGREVPITLTQWDLSFLRGLYAAPVNGFVQGQRAAIARQVRSDMTAAQSD